MYVQPFSSLFFWFFTPLILHNILLVKYALEYSFLRKQMDLTKIRELWLSTLYTVQSKGVKGILWTSRLYFLIPNTAAAYKIWIRAKRTISTLQVNCVYCKLCFLTCPSNNDTQKHIFEVFLSFHFFCGKHLE